jgi:uncharacterized protein (DUF2235 family)
MNGSRNIVVLADGTGNSAAKAFKTNVWRLYQALDLNDAQQIAVFSDGVGTSTFRPFQIIGLALGFGVKRRVLALYKFICLNYEPKDRIYAFGFSRGAFTIRLLVGMIHKEGLVNFASSEDLDRNALAAYRAYRQKTFPCTLPWIAVSRSLRDSFVRAWNRMRKRPVYEDVRPSAGDPRAAENVKIHFLGVWDTVAAYGLPVDELTRAVDRWVWPLSFGDKSLLSSVGCARQAFSIDDERRTFFPIRWDEKPADTDSINGAPPRLKQVWFAGAHANVGGGYADDRLAHVPLCWMIDEAGAHGLRFRRDIVADYKSASSVSGRLYDSRSGFGVLYRYHPRSATDAMSGVTPLVDSSVILRMAKGADGYAPIALPKDINVMTPWGESLTIEALADCATTRSSGKPAPDPDGTRAALAAAAGRIRLAGNASDRSERVEVMLDTVWWRRGLYYVTLVFILMAALYPLFAGYLVVDEAVDIEEGVTALIKPVAGLFSGFLPGFAAPWLEAFVLHPMVAALLGIVISVCLYFGSFLRIRIYDRARAAWNAGLLHDRAMEAPSRALRVARAIRTDKRAIALYNFLRQTALPALFLLLTGALLLSLANKASFEIAGAMGGICSEGDNQSTDGFRTADMCWNTGFEVEKGVTYKIGITIRNSSWLDGDNCADVLGVTNEPGRRDAFNYYMGTLLKRWWGQPYFKPIARIGRYGAEEYVLEPVRPLKDDDRCTNQTMMAKLTPEKTGQLYLYVNDAVIGLPGLFDYFYRPPSNKGEASVSVVEAPE